MEEEIGKTAGAIWDAEKKSRLLAQGRSAYRSRPFKNPRLKLAHKRLISKGRFRQKQAFK